MIINFIISSILDFFTGIFSFLPEVSLSDIPVIGSSVSSTLSLMVTKYNALIETFPYAQTGFLIMVYVILPFEILMLVAKFFLGSRVPNNNI